jgi:hypothetical protein
LLKWALNRKSLLRKVDRLIEAHYGTYQEIMNLTRRDINDIFIILNDKRIEAQLQENGL